jgi:hypothetical protein
MIPLRGEGAMARARRVLESFRPRVAEARMQHVLLTGFGTFPTTPRNATADMIRALAESADVKLRSPAFRSELAVGRGALALPSGMIVSVSLMVLPVAWELAAGLVAKEARATRAGLVVMSGVAPLPAITIEGLAVSANVARVDAFGMKPRHHPRRRVERRLAIATDDAHSAAQRALEHETAGSVTLAEAVRGVDRRAERRDNAYVCNATAFAVEGLSRRGQRMLGSGQSAGVLVPRTFGRRSGFVHWPGAIQAHDAPACGRVLLAMVDALMAAR